MASTKDRSLDIAQHRASRQVTVSPLQPFHFSTDAGRDLSAPGTASSEQTHDTLTPSRTNNVATLRVLVVDDQTTPRRMLINQLRTGLDQSLRVHTAATGRSTVAMLRRQTFDLVLIEYILPDTDGLELIGRIAEFNDQMAMILVTDHGSETVAARAIQCGAVDYLIRHDITPGRLARAATTAVRTARLDDKNRRQMRQLRGAAESADHIVRALSHDMSASMMLMEDSLTRVEGACREAGISPQISDSFAHVTACLGQSKRLLDDLVCLARTGSLDTEPSDVDLNQAAAEVMYEQDAAVSERGVAVTIAPQLGTASCNANRVRQLLTNIVRNALLHGCDAHEPKLTIGPAKTYGTDGDGQIWLRLWDNGPGIPREVRQQVFLPGKRFAATAGTGMGLAIVQRIVSQYDGAVLVDPTCHDGTAIIFSLPARSDG